MKDSYAEKREGLIEQIMYELTGGGVNTDWDLARDKSEEIITLVERALSDKGDYKYKAMEEAMEEFVRRCEAGSVRSKYTYAKFKGILSLPSPPQE